MVHGYATVSHRLNNRWVGGIQNRERAISFGVPGKVAVRLVFDEVTLEAADYVPAVCASGATWQPVRLGGSGKPKRKGRVYGDKTARYLGEAIRAQGLPAGFDLPGFTVREKVRAVGNGVPLPMGRAIADAVLRALAERKAA